MRRNLGDAGVESVFSAEANREEVGVELLGGLPADEVERSFSTVM